MCIVDCIEISVFFLSLKMNQDELELLRERYLKLVDMHGQLQIQNGLLEERILSIVETSGEETNRLERSLADAKEQIGYLQETVNELQIDKQRYKDDCNLAVRLLHRYPNEFISTTSGQIPEQLRNRYESGATPQRSVLIPTFPPTFVAPPSMFTTATTNTSSVTTLSTASQAATAANNLRLTAQTLFKSNTVHRSPSTQILCSNCQQTVRRCDVSVQTSLDDQMINSNSTSRLRLISLTGSDDGLNNDGTWLALDSRINIQEYPMDDTQQLFHESRSTPRMHHV